MSKFKEALQCFSLRRSVALPNSLTSIQVDSAFDRHDPRATLYCVRVEVGATCMIRDDGRSTEQAVEYQTQAMKASIAHEIYGDVYAKLREMYPALARLKCEAYRSREAFDAVQLIEEKMREIHDAISPS